MPRAVDPSRKLARVGLLVGLALVLALPVGPAVAPSLAADGPPDAPACAHASSALATHDVTGHLVPIGPAPVAEHSTGPPADGILESLPNACTGIRPGAAAVTPLGRCTTNFVFTDEHDELYVGTAGHCFSLTGQRLRVDGTEVGTNVWFVDAGVGNDFALVRIDADKRHLVDSAMCHWGGPTRLLTPGADVRGDLVRHHGHGVAYERTPFTQPRSGVGATAAVASSFTVIGQVASGDSGSGVRLDDGHALGVITHVNGGTPFVSHSAPYAYGTSVHRALALASAGTGLQLALVTAPLAE